MSYQALLQEITRLEALNADMLAALKGINECVWTIRSPAHIKAFELLEAAITKAEQKEHA